MAAVRIIIDSRLDQVREIGLNVKAFCLENGLTKDQAVMVEMAVVEAVNNAVIHAYHSLPGGNITVDLEQSESQLVFTISDWGDSFDREAASALKREALRQDPMGESGRGLVIIQTVMDQVDYSSHNGCNTLVLTKQKART